MLQLPPLKLPRVIGHRGAMAYAPENTLTSFREAKARGATWIEIDVKLTADSVPVLMHDPSLERTMGIDRLVAATPCAELPAAVPTFEQAIGCFRELGLGCNVEIKPCEGREVETARAAVATLRRCWPATLPAPLLSSFKDESLKAALQAAPEFARALLVSELTEGWQARAEEVGAAGMNVGSRKLTAVGAMAVKRGGFALSVWTVNDPDEARAIVGMGADCIITDAPDVILRALDGPSS
jgi:glycerophosphoryl diester phosphodiesterase